MLGKPWTNAGPLLYAVDLEQKLRLREGCQLVVLCRTGQRLLLTRLT
jgi:hypothetical protein